MTTAHNKNAFNELVDSYTGPAFRYMGLSIAVTYPSLSILAVDNGSTDGSVEAVPNAIWSAGDGVGRRLGMLRRFYD